MSTKQFSSKPVKVGKKIVKLTIKLACASAWAALAAVPLMAAAQDKTADYPNRTVRMVVPFPAGQATDINARLIAERLSTRWGQQVYVDNRGGGNGIPGMMAGRQAAADGYTIIFGSSSTTSVNEALYPNLPYSTRDFVPVAAVFSQPWLIVTSPNAPYANLKDVVDAAKTSPGKLNWGFGAVALELAGELLKQQAEIDIRPINYKGSAATVTDLSGGHIELAIETMAATLPHIKSGRIKAIAILSEQRSPLLPEVPTVAEQGFPGFVALGWAGLFVPNGTPLDVVDKIAADVNQVLSEPAVQEAIAKQGSVAENKSRSEWESFVTSETAKWTQAIKKGNIKVPE